MFSQGRYVIIWKIPCDSCTSGLQLKEWVWTHKNNDPYPPQEIYSVKEKII